MLSGGVPVFVDNGILLSFLRSETEAAAESLKGGVGAVVSRLEGLKEGGKVTQSLEAFLLVYKVADVMAVVATASELTGIARLLYFPQLDTAVQPNDGAEGERRQHTPLSSKNLETGPSSDESLRQANSLVSVNLHALNRRIGGQMFGVESF